MSSITKLHRRRRPALEQDKFSSAVKTVQILQFARHDLKKNFKCAHDYQILSRFLDGSNKFCQSSASGPMYDNIIEGLVPVMCDGRCLTGCLEIDDFDAKCVT